MDNNRIMFSPYNKNELYEIKKPKGDDCNIFSENTLRVSSMKAASVNGDLRRIIKILNKAKKIFELQNIKNKKNKNGKEFIIQAY